MILISHQMAYQKHFIVFIVVLAKIHHSASQEGEWPENVRHLEPGCIMGGICHRYDTLNGERALNCLIEDHEDNSPQLLDNQTAIEQLREFCADTLDSYGEEPGGGYAAEQIPELSEQLIMVRGIIARCPRCWRNVRQVFCELTCSPYQIYFQRPHQIEPTPGYNASDPTSPLRPRMVRELALYHTERYARTTYESCKDIKTGADNDIPAMDFLCGPYGSSRCSPERWFGYMGDIRNNYAPFQVHFRYPDNSTEEDRINAFDGVTYSCDEARPGDNSCSCVDCEESCSAASIAAHNPWGKPNYVLWFVPIWFEILRFGFGYL